MQHQLGPLEEELKKTREKLKAAEEEKDQALDELVEMKKVSKEANMRLSEALTAQKRAYSMGESIETLKSELQVAKDCLLRAREGEELASSKARSLDKEMNLLRTELKLATEAEEKSKTAMDDLALALKEVSAEAKEVTGKLSSTQLELDNARGEAEQLKQLMKSTKEKYERLLDEAKKEIDQVRDKVERLKLEAEESSLTWSEKEIEFVNCIRRAEEECNTAKQENGRLAASLRVAEDMVKMSKQENGNLRDILKQALNESSVAKEAAEIARAENSQLKDSIVDKDEALQSLVRENERLRKNEATTAENVKDLKMTFLSTKPIDDLKADDKEMDGVIKKQNSIVEEHKNGNKKLAKVLSLHLEDPRISNGFRKVNVDTERTTSVVFIDDGEMTNSDDFDHIDQTQVDSMDSHRNSQRKKKALMRKFGDLLKKTSYRTQKGAIN
ncbi:PREDICTED: putative WEB family protein At1g65010, chloroplastic [Nelumbo nucifera]|uniref:CID domain-containing protein n=2 Tax=Nelumbo nucifera TaxID=4432 RepID=A0A822XPN6_NELNU|nr:PREDICTED: putative WEB family protein At1g65010, chloroplastic [Nelumbo nucifera]DAD22012.1 TPA_asm: hypothetical protein HUJ06_023475 [Nelumbo nucifera]